MAGITAEHPGAGYSGRVEEWAGEGGCFSPLRFEVMGGIVREHPVKSAS
jgi:hypothetical protein